MFLKAFRAWDVATYIGQLVESAKKLVEKADQVLGWALRGQVREANDVRKQDAAMIIMHVN